MGKIVYEDIKATECAVNKRDNRCRNRVKIYTPKRYRGKHVVKMLSGRQSAAYISKLALLTAVSFILYAFCKFPMPFAFPGFLEIQISELPAMLAGFSMGPVAGCIVIILKCLFKLPMTGTAYVGEFTDIILGIAFVLPASIIYRRRKDKKHAIIGLAVGTAALTVASVILNRFVSIPFYLEMFFNGDWNVLLNIVRPIYPAVTQNTFYAYYLGIGVVPFNLLRCIIVSVITFFIYKRLSRILHWDGHSFGKKKLSGKHVSDSVEETYELAERIAATLTGGEILLLSGELGAGKTTFTKGLAAALGVTEEVTSPTFTISNVYESGRLKLNHIDMYRIENEEEITELGIEDAIPEDGVTVIEWNKFERLTGRIITVNIEYADGDGRLFEVSDSAETAEEKKKI